MTTEYRGFTVPTTADAPSGPQLAQDLVDDVIAYRTAGVMVKKVRNTAAGGGVGSTPVNMAAPYVIPASPFGAGVPYRVRVSGAARVTCPPTAGYNLQARVDGTTVEERTISHTGSASTNLVRDVEGASMVINPDVTHTASVTITSTSAGLTVLNDILLNVIVEIAPATELP